MIPYEHIHTLWSGWLSKLIGALSLGIAIIAELISFVWKWCYQYPFVLGMIAAYWACVILVWAQRALFASLQQLAALGAYSVEGVGATGLGPDGMEQGMAAITKMSSYASIVTDWLSFIDFFVPLHELLLAVTILGGLKLGALIYRFVKSWIPAVS